MNRHCVFVRHALGIAAALGTLSASTTATASLRQDSETSRLEHRLVTTSQNPVVQPDSGAGRGNPSGPRPPAGRTPLLREGSFIVETPGRLYLDEHIGFWMFEAESTHLPTTPGHRIPLRFIMLPSTKLQQMQRTVETGSLSTLFIVTGRVFVYADTNYLLAVDAAIHEQRPPALPDDPVDPGADAGEKSDDDDDAESIIARVREAVPIARALAPATDDAADDDLDSLKPEGTLIVMRRGRVVRNARGGWEFVFTADGEGQQDPPMTILPCLLLESMQRDAQQRNTRDSMLVSGQVYTYRGRNYLLPTLFQVHRFNPNLQR